MSVEIYDIETYNEAFIFCSIDRETLRRTHFEISFRKDDTIKLIEHLRNIKGQIGYNTLKFDYPILHWMIYNYQNYNQYSFPSAICEKAQEVIKDENSDIHPSKVLIPQLDLFRIWHYGNKARSTSLKYLEFTMRTDNIEDLPYAIYDSLTGEMIDKIIDYCYHDVEETHKFYLKSIGRINLRKNFEKKYNIPLLNRPDVGIAEDLMLDSYCKQTNKNKSEVKQLRSHYDFIQGRDVILPIIEFQTPQMKEWLDKLKQTWLKAKGGFWKGETIELFGEKYQIGLGGLHIVQKPSIFEKGENELITERDCAGMYPTFISLHGLYPKHLGKEFLTLYRQIREDRMIAKEIGDKIMDAAGKLIGNGLFGKFGSEYSWLYDLKMLYRTTLNNQLFLLMLIEQCGLHNINVISANTDSITTHIKTEQLLVLNRLIEQWEKISLHTLESTEYDKIVFRDVNNYVALKSDGKYKYKGAFDTFEDSQSEKFDGWHKNQSMLIVPKALREYLFNQTPLKESIINHGDIFDFCKAVKGKRDTSFIEKYIINGKYSTKELPKRVNRYIVTNKGSKLIKILPPLVNEQGELKSDKLLKYRRANPTQLDMFHFTDDVAITKNREIEVESGHQVTIMNRITDKNVESYDINYDYYINECHKILKEIEITQPLKIAA